MPSPLTAGHSETDMPLTYAPLVLPQGALPVGQYSKKVLEFVNTTRHYIRLDTREKQTVRERC